MSRRSVDGFLPRQDSDFEGLGPADETGLSVRTHAAHPLAINDQKDPVLVHGEDGYRCLLLITPADDATNSLPGHGLSRSDRRCLALASSNSPHTHHEPPRQARTEISQRDLMKEGQPVP